MDARSALEGIDLKTGIIGQHPTGRLWVELWVGEDPRGEGA